MGLRVLAYVGDFLEFPQSGFTVSDATLKNKRELIKRLLRGTLRGLQFTLKNRAETVRFIAKDYKLQERGGGQSLYFAAAGHERKRTGDGQRD